MLPAMTSAAPVSQLYEGNYLHSCHDSTDETPCPLYQNEKIVQQPADFLTLTENYVKGAESFIKTVAAGIRKSLLYIIAHVIFSLPLNHMVSVSLYRKEKPILSLCGLPTHSPSSVCWEDVQELQHQRNIW